MNHEQIRQNLHAFFDGELLGETRREVEEHLKVCAECRLELGEWEKISRALFRAPAVDPSDFFVAGVMDKIHDAQRFPVARRSLLARWLVPEWGANAMPSRLLLAGAALAAVLLFVQPVRHDVPAQRAAADVEYMADLMQGPYGDNGESRIGTEIEEFFL